MGKRFTPGIVYRFCSAMLAMALFSACGASPQPAASAANSAPRAATPALPTAQPPESPGQDPFTFYIELEGTLYALPAHASTFLQNGWQAQANPGEELAPLQTARVLFTRDGSSLPVTLANTGTTSRPWEDCLVAGVLLESSNSDAPTLLLSGGLGLSSTPQDVRALCGSPDEDAIMAIGSAAASSPASAPTDAEGAQTLTYTVGRHSHLRFTFGPAGGMQSMEAYSLYPPAAPPQPDTLPQAVRAYSPSEVIGENWQDFTFLYGGNLYTLPAPVAAFLQNGWQLRDEGRLAAGGWVTGVCLQKGNQVLRTTLRNADAAEQPFTGCFVVVAESAATSMRLPLQLAAGITQNSTQEDILAAYGEPHAWDTTGMFSWEFSYLAENGRLIFRFDRETGLLYDLEIWNDIPGR